MLKGFTEGKLYITETNSNSHQVSNEGVADFIFKHGIRPITPEEVVALNEETKRELPAHLTLLKPYGDTRSNNSVVNGHLLSVGYLQERENRDWLEEGWSK